MAQVPQPAHGTIKDASAAIRLGKALFWDAQAGSDGQMACASCHFKAGADARTKSTVNPGADAAFQIALNAGATLTLATFSGDDIVGSSGVLSRAFGSISSDLNDPVDICSAVTPSDAAQAALFNAGERLVTGRQAPPAVGAVFNRDNFWDGRASHKFNHQNPLGAASVPAGPFVENASLASQAVGPPLSNVEMSCAGRAFNGPNSLGAKLVPRTPLALQLVDPRDSVLGPLSNSPSPGLACGFPDRLCTYADLIAGAFEVPAGQDPVAFFIANFSSIWGQAIQAYEATLVPDRTPYDLGTLTPSQTAGLTTFRAKCAACHAEPELTDATVNFAALHGDLNADGGDQGFHNIGVTPTASDLGRGGQAGGFDLSVSKSTFDRGAFKTPALRNVKLTAPYMHNGRLATLDDVVAFYDDQNNLQVKNAELASAMNNAKVGGSATTRANLVDFLGDGLTDCRVEHELAPFDHPALALPNGPSLPARGRAGDGTSCP